MLEVNMKKKVRAHVIVSGRVQGVFFRMETKRAADRYGVSGWVRNKRDGTVEAIFEGDQESVNLSLEWCKEGPPYSKVTNIDVKWNNYTGEFQGFEITY
jgi:acylphosphatase